MSNTLNKLKYCSYFCTECIMCSMCLLSIVVLILVAVANNSLDISFAATTQLSDDWERKMITDIVFMPEGEKCPAGWRELFVRRWGGIDQGCEVLGKIITEREYVYVPSGGRNRSKPSCSKTN